MEIVITNLELAILEKLRKVGVMSWEIATNQGPLALDALVKKGFASKSVDLNKGTIEWHLLGKDE